MREHGATDGGAAIHARVVRITADGAGLTVDMCGVTRLLVPAFLVAIVVSSMAGSDLLGWVAAAATAAALLAVQRVRGSGASCAIPRSEETTSDTTTWDEATPRP